MIEVLKNITDKRLLLVALCFFPVMKVVSWYPALAMSPIWVLLALPIIAAAISMAFEVFP